MTAIQDILLPYQRRFITNQKKRKVWISSRQAGKSFTLAYLLNQAACLNPNCLNVALSVNLRSAGEIIKKCIDFARAIEYLTHGQITFTSGFDHVNFSNGSRIMSLPCTNPGSLRGWTIGQNGVLAIDEFFFIDHLEEIMQAISPSLTRNQTASLVLTSTPGSVNSYAYKLYEQALQSDEWYVQHTPIEAAIKDGLKVDIDSLHTLCPDPDVFAQEYECAFIKGASEFIDPDLLQFSSVIPVNGAEYLGVDIGRNHDHSVIVKIIVKDGKIYVQKIITLEKTPFVEQQQIILKTAEQAKNFQYGFIDATGIGNPVAEYCNTSNKKLAPFTFTGSNKSGLYEFLRAKIFENNIVFAPEYKDILITDIRNIQRITDGNNVKFVAAHTATGHADIISALVLALHAYRTHLPSIAMPLPYRHFSRF